MPFGNLNRDRNGYIILPNSKLEDPITELAPLKVKDLPVINTIDPEKLYQLVTIMVNSANNCAGLIFNTFEDLEQSTLDKLRYKFLVPIFPIRPFHKFCPPSSSSLIAHHETCISWLDRQEPGSVIYVSFGSIAAIEQPEYEEIAWGLRNSGRPFLWVIRPSSVDGVDGLNPGLEERGCIVKWAPQVEVLSHPSVGAFWTHCGWNSTLESISEGVPMICMPCFTDQKVNSRFVCDVWRVGVELESSNGLERGKIQRAIRRLFDEKDGEEIRDRMLHLKEKASLCLKQGGSTFQSIGGLSDHILSLESLTFSARESTV
ncbi:hypothetical protein CDL15_Pgr025858 [Punica granatum]|uniref:UDP-glycosyltransferases domain-containing protein n=2 Tax=Punica granatum TaxID=22663 RepID=A0A218WBY8_PUNGR|nr:hypothetical protein CDL15_Pgr025858 [Punica granatum]